MLLVKNRNNWINFVVGGGSIDTVLFVLKKRPDHRKSIGGLEVECCLCGVGQQNGLGGVPHSSLAHP